MMYGDLDISRIDEMPPGRKRVSTYVVNEEFRTRLNGFIRKQVDNGNQVYIVCPAVEEQKIDSENVTDYNPFELALDDEQPPLKAAVQYAQELAERMPDLNIAFIHGKLKAKEKDAIMMDFANNKINVLVSTTVIEVGVNVPNATLMIVENAERFGLSQLHQLRGRVGRGRDQAYCVLVSDAKSQNAKTRLEIMRTTYDGYTIAEKDLKMRGPGDFFASGNSIRQSGDMGFDIAKNCNDSALAQAAFSSAKALIKADSSLSLPEHSLLLNRITEIYNEKANTIN
jgi:ATP-dependent DNA helicase RecG